uniref:Type IV pilin n=1 Tax=Thermofilum adornatum TaxID=1365176 RepID=A0A7C1CEH4_9CREN
MWPKAFRKRKGSVPPFVVALITIVIIAAAVLVSWWYFALTRNVLNQPVLDITDAYYVSPNLYITIRNLGGYNVTVNTFSVLCSGSQISMQTGFIPAGTTKTFQNSGPASGLYDGESCVAKLTITNWATNKQQDVNIPFRVTVP